MIDGGFFMSKKLIYATCLAFTGWWACKKVEPTAQKTENQENSPSSSSLTSSSSIPKEIENTTQAILEGSSSSLASSLEKKNIF